MKEKSLRLKVTCLTPKGKAEKASKSFGMRYFDLLNKPLETKIVSDTEFYYVYEYKKEKTMENMINKKIPAGIQKIRGIYLLIIHLVDKGNKLGKKGAWTVERVRRWMLKRLNKQVKNPRELEDFVDAIDIKDKNEIMELLAKDMISYKILGGK